MLIVANWKMNGALAASRELAGAIATGVAQLRGAPDVVICPPFPFLAAVADALAQTPIGLGAQHVSEHAPGAFTGEVACAMLVELGCRWVIVGHSERRALFGASSEQVAAKARAALSAGLNPIICVGESLEAREAGRTEAVVAAQLNPVVALLREQPGRAVVAYEPVWAIGTGRSASPNEAGAVHAFIRHQVCGAGLDSSAPVRILYGGSVRPDNAAALFDTEGIDGGLIGGASLKAPEFLAIVRAGCAARSTTGVH